MEQRVRTQHPDGDDVDPHLEGVCEHLCRQLVDVPQFRPLASR